MNTTRPFPCTGDIVLMDADKGVRVPVVATQTILRRKRATFSHAAIAIDDEAYVDSVTKRGIGVGRWSELSPSLPIRAFRMRSADPEKLIPAMLEHYGRAYNYLFALKNSAAFRERHRNKYYCSEFVAQVYSVSQLGLNPRNRLILPSDLENLGNNPNWDDVTHLYQPILGVSQSAREFSNASIFEQVGQTAEAARRGTAEFEKMIKQVDDLNASITRSTIKLRDLTAKVAARKKI